jgi:tetratricopeptide (TPR) repeat protein
MQIFPDEKDIEKDILASLSTSVKASLKLNRQDEVTAEICEIVKLCVDSLVADKKITQDVDTQKAWVFYLKADEAYKAGQFDSALKFIHESIHLSAREYSFYKLWEVLKGLDRPAEAQEAFETAEKMRIAMEKK